MAESSKAYFEAYSHVLKSLQRPEMDHLPFQRQLLQLLLALGRHVAPPSHILTRQETDKYVVGNTFDGILGDLGRDWIRVLGEWPDSSLDVS